MGGFPALQQHVNQGSKGARQRNDILRQRFKAGGLPEVRQCYVLIRR